MDLLAVISWKPIPIYQLGSLNLSLHGLFAGIGFVLGGWLATRILERRGMDTSAYQSVLTWGIVGALLGARYLTTPAAIIGGMPLSMALHPLHGSFSIMGGFAGGILAGIWRMKQVGLPILPTLDASAFGLVLGTIVGRIGDLAIVEHLGRATTAPWGYAVRAGYDLAPQHNGLECSTDFVGPNCGVYHPVMAYDLLGAGVLIGVLFLLSRSNRLKSGQLFSFWIVWYGIQRLILDRLRFGLGDATIGPFTWNQISGAAGALFGVWLFAHFRDRELAGTTHHLEEPLATMPAPSEHVNQTET